MIIKNGPGLRLEVFVECERGRIADDLNGLFTVVGFSDACDVLYLEDENAWTYRLTAALPGQTFARDFCQRGTLISAAFTARRVQ